MPRPPSQPLTSPSASSSASYSPVDQPSHPFEPTTASHDRRLADLSKTLAADSELANALWTVVRDLRREGPRRGDGDEEPAHMDAMSDGLTTGRSPSRRRPFPSPTGGDAPRRSSVRRSTTPEERRCRTEAPRARRPSPGGRSAGESDELDEGASSDDERKVGDAQPLLREAWPKGEAGPVDAGGLEASRRSAPRSRTTVSSAPDLPGRLAFPHPLHSPAPAAPNAPPPRLSVSPRPASPPPDPASWYSPSSLLPHKPKKKININFEFPSHFNSAGLPQFAHNQYLPLRLMEDQPPYHDDQHNAAEEGRLTVVRRPYRRHQEDGGDNVLFPTLLSLAVVLLPVLVMCLVLGAIFAAVGVKL